MIKFVKLVTGETVIGSYNQERDGLEDVALIQVIPGSAGIQIAIVPYGFPFEEKISGFVSMDKVVYEYSKVPEDLENKYLEAKSNIKISSAMPQANPFSSQKKEEKVIDVENLFKK
ncbi:hypothetical protein [Hippea maritima]|uniref:Uncharacterized protein n=1 Tax=Hippea maritima (strain ATCC 700847 / DSM 10411 / MH2) TaxID=760142 RepID=F2LY94_HIPMA|nr:hypothetical protein [Hippea maritima]AEA34417.1 hypothetical protein Hipma_1461 [Hippea maritima DSM 10411]